MKLTPHRPKSTPAVPLAPAPAPIAFRSRLILCAAGLLGAAGVVAAAAGAHVGGAGQLSSAAGIMLVHAAAMVGIAVFGIVRAVERPTSDIAAALLFIGSALFAADIAVRAVTGTAILPYAAPTGGVVMIVGWVALAISALLKR